MYSAPLANVSQTRKRAAGSSVTLTSWQAGESRDLSGFFLRCVNLWKLILDSTHSSHLYWDQWIEINHKEIALLQSCKRWEAYCIWRKSKQAMVWRVCWTWPSGCSVPKCKRDYCGDTHGERIYPWAEQCHSDWWLSQGHDDLHAAIVLCHWQIP